MKKHLISFLILSFIIQSSHAQFVKEKSISAQIGFVSSMAFNSAEDTSNNGFFTQGELILKLTSWAELRPYAGLVWTGTQGYDFDGNPTYEKSETKALMLGGKARLRAPIPWFAPYIELGAGTSIGKFDTFTLFTDIEKGGIIPHIPISFGVELGKRNNVDLGLAFYSQPTVEQMVGIFAFGLSFPIK
ncbi:hypothetical protein [Maribacter aurantiacus]|uniref:Outer membrane protein beta-barrel domain-containing protein n=1 Tax=Maribacter aurantiacus TaxID=1882343 RepID=A0A5R8LSL7_9FLAO|nr:hypothetical protein [Maribacter aurantiacus]TLF40231.1 hypothetical protein FEK29_17670 [Maribacter aurantiacus]